MISNSGKDENRKYHGGVAGDQGGEWNIINWYNRPWNCILRHPDVKVRAKIAELARKSALNNMIGYDQYQRNTFWTQLQMVNYDPSKIKTPCEADCSAGVIAITKAVGYLLGINALKNVNATYTGNMRTGFRNAGFEVLTASKYLTSDAYLLSGDILLNDNAHTAINLDNGSKASATDVKNWLEKGDTGAEVKTMQTMLIACGVSCGSCGADGSFGNDTDKAVRKYQELRGLDVDGSYGPLTKAKLTAEYNALKKTEKKCYSGAYPVMPTRGYYLKGDGYERLINYSSQIKRIQSLLNWIMDGNLSVDGDYGPKTEALCAKYQKKYGLKVDGSFGKESLAKARTIKK